MPTRYSQVDRLARLLLLQAPTYPSAQTLSPSARADPGFRKELCERVMQLDFDCLPNWGIDGLRNPSQVTKQNWFFLDRAFRRKALLRFRCLDTARLQTVLSSAVEYVIGATCPILGIGIYGSYLYGSSQQFRDLDVLVLIESPTDVAVDAVRCSDERLPYALRIDGAPTVCTTELGLTIIGRKALNRGNHSFIVTEAALLDSTITLSIGQCIDAPPLTPFLLTLNARKLVKWALGEIFVEPAKTLNLLDQVVRQRNMMCRQYTGIPFKGVSEMHYFQQSRTELTTDLTARLVLQP